MSMVEPKKTGTRSSSRAGRRTFLALGGSVATGAIGLGATGCRGVTTGNNKAGNSEQLSISWWAEGKRTQLHLKVLKQYEAAHSGVTVRPQYQPLKGYDDKLSTQMSGGNAPDIFELRRETFADYISRGAVRRLDDLVPDTLPFDKLPKSLQSAAQYKGRWYAIPLGLATSPALIADSVVLSKLGVGKPKASWTFDDFHILLTAIRKASGGRIYGSDDMSGSDGAFGAYLAGAGKPLFTDAGKPGFSRDDLGRWLELWEQFRKDQLVPPMKVTAAGTGFTSDPLVKGTAALTLAASSKGITGYQPLVKHQLELLSFPRRSASGPGATSVGPIEWFALSSRLDTATAKRAAGLCMYFVDGTEAVKTLDLSHGVPLFADTRKQTYPTQSKINKLLYDNVQQIDELGPAPVASYPPGASEFLTDFANQNQLVGFGKTTVDKAVAAIFDDADRLLK